MSIEIVDLPMKMVDLSIVYVNVYQRVRGFSILNQPFWDTVGPSPSPRGRPVAPWPRLCFGLGLRHLALALPGPGACLACAACAKED